ncbi:DegT/DnrJ/EryC1/StrS family aminotransferase [Streptomyces sp. NPDC057496]|uniref:DegT/DnrJ/EryC1/StrS family aminotransferase n=1 Tax=Streptomyces sp. NPDC057496 TaxID=3346149 RepID=UPI00369F96E3
MKNPLPASLGGVPVLETEIPMARPTVVSDGPLFESMREILSSGQMTNGRHVAAFEREVADWVGVEHAVAVSNCTTGLLLVLRCLGVSGNVVLPSFTFIASGHAVLWNGLAPVFADVRTDSFCLDPDRVDAALGGDTGAILSVHTFGAPCDMEALESLAAARGVPLVVDAAHGFGARYEDDSRVGTKGIAEVFSLSPTKPFSTGEGGIVTTNDAALARDLRIARNYGNPGSYDSVLLGLNGRLPEIAAAIGRRSLPHLSGWLDRRVALAERYRSNLGDLPGISFQQVRNGAKSVYKDLCVLVEPEQFGLDCSQLEKALTAENIPSRRYFAPPLHRQSVYRKWASGTADPLKGTEWLADRALTLPLYSHMAADVVDSVCEAVRLIQEHADSLRAALPPR